jgi:hypothetical protein
MLAIQVALLGVGLWYMDRSPNEIVWAVPVVSNFKMAVIATYSCGRFEASRQATPRTLGAGDGMPGVTWIEQRRQRRRRLRLFSFIGASVLVFTASMALLVGTALGLLVQFGAQCGLCAAMILEKELWRVWLAKKSREDDCETSMTQLMSSAGGYFGAAPGTPGTPGQRNESERLRSPLPVGRVEAEPFPMQQSRFSRDSWRWFQ